MNSGCSASSGSAGHSSSACLHDLVEPEVAALLHLALGLGVAHHDDRLEALEVAHLLVDLRLDRRRLALAPRAVDGDQRLGLGELHPLPDRARREAAEDDVVRRADARAGQHRHDDLGDHRQEDPDHVALLDAAVLQRVGEALDVAVQVRVGDVALLALLAAPVEGDPVAPARLDVAVDAVVGDVELAAHEPLGERRVRTSRAPGPTPCASPAPRPARPRSPRSPPRPPRRSPRPRPPPAPRSPPGARTSPGRAGSSISCSSVVPPSAISAPPGTSSSLGNLVPGSAFSAPRPVSERTNSSWKERSAPCSLRQQRADHAAEEAERDRDDARVGERPADRRARLGVGARPHARRDDDQEDRRHDAEHARRRRRPWC